MGSLNKVLLIGTLGRDPESRTMQDGSPVVNLSMATSEIWRDKSSGEKRERTEWHRIVIFNENLAKVAQNYLKKGSQVYIEGSLQTRKWTDQSGVEKYTTEVVLQRYRGELTMLGGKSMGEPMPEIGHGSTPAQTTEYHIQNPTTGMDQSPVNNSTNLDDEIPF